MWLTFICELIYNDCMTDIRDYKIWYPYEAFYIESMLIVTRSAMIVQSELQEIIKQLQDGKQLTEHDTVFIIDMCQNLLISAGALSRYFWPVRNKEVHLLRGERLRESFEIEDGNPLKDRHVRNYMEHFDENLDIYLSPGRIAGNIIPSAVGSNLNNSQGVLHFIRAFHINDWTFEILGNKVKLIPLINEVIRIHILLEKFQEEGSRLPQSN